MYRVVPVSDGIVLDTLKFDILKPSVVVHALLGPTPETPTHATLVFDLLWPPSMIHLSTEHPSRSWMSGRSDPATFPRLSHVRLISPHFPWMIDVKNNAGVTCGDVAQRISSFMLQRVDKSEWDPLSQEDKAEIGNSYNWNRSTARGAPGGACPRVSQGSTSLGSALALQVSSVMIDSLRTDLVPSLALLSLRSWLSGRFLLVLLIMHASYCV